MRLGNDIEVTSPSRALTTSPDRIKRWFIAVLEPARDHRVIRPIRRGVSQIALIGMGLAMYLAVRVFTEGAEGAAFDNAKSVLHFESVFGLDWEQAAQAMILDSDQATQFFSWFYAWAYWPAIAGTLLAFWFIDKSRYAVFRDGLFFSGVAGLFIFSLYPVAPPRMLDGFTDTVAGMSGGVVAQPKGLINEFAALPSFHAGWFALCSAMVITVVHGPLLRLLAFLPGAMMSLTVVLTANHYVVDVILGIAFSFAGLGVAAVVHRRLRTVAAVGNPVCLTEPVGAPRWSRSAIQANVAAAIARSSS